VYAIELDPSVMEDPAFRAKNPQWVPGMPLVYVGMTSLSSAEERFAQHLGGTKNVSRIAHRYGRRLRMDLVPYRKPTRRTRAMKMEQRLAKALRSRGFGAWQG
jgi:predicted GIY-YIG superfamily endonuclease